jgi:hypothetical protein
VIHAIGHVLGLDNPSGAWYLWWSGVGADLGILGAVAGAYRRMNCEVHGCWRLGRHATAAGHRVCRLHHPLDKITPDVVAAAHEEAAQR